MNLKNKIALRISVALIVSMFAIIAIVAVNIRLLNIQLTKDKALVVAEITKDALTAHMVNNIMDKRDLFLSNIAHLKNVQNLRVIRSENVQKQFGKTRENETPVDEIDREVLKNGKAVEKVSEDLMSANLRITVPYTANTNGNPNCLQCHNAKEGEVLGAITMNFDLAEAKDYGIGTILKIILISLFSLLGIMYMLRAYLTPYLDLFVQLTEKINHANNGDFSQRIETSIKGEAQDAAVGFNNFMQKLQDSFNKIEHNIRTFLPHQNSKNEDPITKMEGVVNGLADIYKFKRTIEDDVSKSEVYNRISTLLGSKFGIKEFAIFELENDKNSFEQVINTSSHKCCAGSTEENSNLCRANRIGKTIVSDDFEQICPNFLLENTNHLCIPVNIGGKIGLVINIMSKDSDDYKRIKEIIPTIKNYLSEASSVIESKKLTEKLKDTSLRDALTGLYNRRFLDEYLSNIVPQLTRNKKRLAILMIDMDHFKMVNDTYGHDIGDSILKRLSTTLLENIRESDVVFRYGGEEFIIVLNDISCDEDAIKIAEKLREKAKSMKLKAGSEILEKTISIGVAVFPDDAEQIWKCIKFADTALYQAKSTGRNKVVKFNQTMWDGEEQGPY